MTADKSVFKELYAILYRRADEEKAKCYEKLMKLPNNVSGVEIAKISLIPNNISVDKG